MWSQYSFQKTGGEGLQYIGKPKFNLSERSFALVRNISMCWEIFYDFEKYFRGQAESRSAISWQPLNSICQRQ